MVMIGPGFILLGQSSFRFSDPKADRLSLAFDVSQNLIIIPATINKSSRLQLVIDSGISNTIITGLTESDSIHMNAVRKIKVGGLGGGISVDALYSNGNQVEIGPQEDTDPVIQGDNMDIYILGSDHFELSRQLGIKVHGLIGSELFENYVIGIDHVTKEIAFYDRDKFNFKKRTRSFSKIPIRVIQGKAYLDVEMLQENDSVLKAKLLIDTGASLSFWIAPTADSTIVLPAKTVRSLLGQGLNGFITGVNGRVKKATIGPFAFRNPLVSYPDSVSVAGLKLDTDRQGSIGNDVLRRFTVFFDFKGSAIYLKPNKLFSNPFSYNRSGMDIEKMDPMIPVYSIYNIIPGSSADRAGLQAGDLIEYINYLPAISLSLDDINNILYGNSGQSVILKVDRYGEKLKVKFRLAEKI